MRMLLRCALLSMCALLAFYLASPLFHKRGYVFLDPKVSENLDNSSIINTQKISIPGYRKSFNPSLIPFKEGYLLSFRYRGKTRLSPKEKEARIDPSFIGLAQLDKNFKCIRKSAQLLDILSYSSEISKTAEDARLFTWGERIFIIFNDLPLARKNNGYALYLGELIEQNGKFTLKEKVLPLQYTNATAIEKNWVPFISEAKLFLIYDNRPKRIILEVDAQTGNCKEVSAIPSHFDWKWGQIWGGTPAYPIDDQFLTFFHSFISVKASEADPRSKRGRNYVMGAYTFDLNYPFAVRAISSIPLGNLTDYTTDNRHRIIFPGGLVIEENLIHVVWGKNNTQILLTTFDKQKLLDSLVSTP